MIRWALPLWLLLLARPALAQEQDPDTKKPRPLVDGGVDDKPFIVGAGNARLGGYIDASAVYEREDGTPSDVGFALRRLNLFTFAAVSSKIRVITEVEFEDGGDEVVIELGIVDVALSQALNLRAGMILIPIGRFNLAHDSPQNLMVDRPLTSRELIPGTLSEPGLGIYGAVYPSTHMRLTYELYLVNGLGAGIASGSTGGTSFQDGKGNLQDENRHPSAVTRVALSPIPAIEFAFSAYGGPWNNYDSVDGRLDKKRWLGMFAFDATANYSWAKITLELVQTAIDLPPSLPKDTFAQVQRGLFVETSIPIVKGMGPDFPAAQLRATGRYEFVDRNASRRGDSTHQLSVGINWLPTSDTAIKLNYRRSRSRDIGLNPVDAAGLQLGFASYF